MTIFECVARGIFYGEVEVAAQIRGICPDAAFGDNVGDRDFFRHAIQRRSEIHYQYDGD